MYFRQLTYGPAGCASYVLGCTTSGAAVVVDPLASLGIPEYLFAAAQGNVLIKYVIDTHIHADHESIGRALADAAEAEYCLGAAAEGLVRFPFRPLHDGEELRCGNLLIKVVNTPGHTPESVSLIVTDLGRGDQPWFVLTGDTLMVGDVGRPDLVLGDSTLKEEGVHDRAQALYRSLQERILTLPDYVEVYPGHYGGSTCGGPGMSAKAASTIGFERMLNLALQHQDPRSFADSVLAQLKPQPENFQQLKRRNMGWE